MSGFCLDNFASFLSMGGDAASILSLGGSLLSRVIGSIVRQTAKRNFGRKKAGRKEQQIKIAELEAEVAQLSYGNEVLLSMIPSIVQMVLEYAKTQGEGFRIEGDTVYYVTGNTGDIYLDSTIESGDTLRRTSNSIQRIREKKRTRQLSSSELGD